MRNGLHVLDRIDLVEEGAWDRLITDDNPFLRHAFLAALESTGCLRPDWGWQAAHPTLWQQGHLVAAAPGYRKTNSHGEFVFDHAWAEAYAHFGLRYYPKWLLAVPYSPVPGPRLLARDLQARTNLLDEVCAHARREGLSSVHVNFVAEEQHAAFGADWLPRIDVQYHWHNRGQWRNFEEFLAALTARKRKNIRAERRRVQAHGLRWRHLSGDAIGPRECAAMYTFYRNTFAAHGNAPALTLAFFTHLHHRMPASVLLILGEIDREPVCGAWFLRSASRLYGRYWGCNRDIPGLHFEACYYQAIDYCLQHGIAAFEPGAQGEHKLARGFAPVYTHSRHWLSEARLRPALAAWCRHEHAALTRYAENLSAHSPYRSN